MYFGRIGCPQSKEKCTWSLKIQVSGLLPLVVCPVRWNRVSKLNAGARRHYDLRRSVAAPYSTDLQKYSNR